MLKLNIDLDTVTAEDLSKNYSLYQQLLTVFEIVDGRKPEGTCCGKGKESAIKKFVDHRDDYVMAINEIRFRLIKPKFSGALYFTKVGKRYNADRLTDKQMLLLIDSGYTDLFDATEYYKMQAEVDAELENVFPDVEGEMKRQQIEDLTQPEEPLLSFEVLSSPETSGMTVSFTEVNEPIDDKIKPAKKATRKRKTTKKSK